MSSFWGAPTWVFLHTFAEKINSNYFSIQKKSIIKLIKTICENLPCPNCRMHANEYMKRVNSSNVNSKEKLIAMLIHFHNNVNERLGKQRFNANFYDQYKKNKLNFVFENFQKTFAKRYTSALSRTQNELYMENQRIELTKKIYFFLKANRKNFKSL